MKKTIIITLLIISKLVCYSQTTEKYFRHPELNNYAGIWTYKTNGVTLNVYLTVDKVTNAEAKTSVDLLQGFYVISKNGKKMVDTADHKKTLTMGSIYDKDKNVIMLFLVDRLKGNKRGHVLMTFSADNKTATWQLMKEEAIEFKVKGKAIDSAKRDRSYSIPTNIVLTKVE